MSANQKNFAKPANFGKFERKGSTFYWQYNYRNNPEMVRHGYSKPQGQSEKPDKMKLLEDILTRLFIKGTYLKQIEKFMMYRCVSNDNKDNIELFTIYPHNYQLSAILLPQQRTEEVKNIKRLLDTLYADPTEVYGVKDPMNVADLFKSSAATVAEPKEAAQVIPIDELMTKYAKRPFKSWDEFTSFTNDQFVVYTQAQRQAFIQKVLEYQPGLVDKVDKWKKGAAR